ncbi:MAG: hypothetical protein ACREJ2_11160 [Planctomycetota bacterium]
MWRLGLTTIATLTILLDLLVPQQMWVSTTCCTRTLQFTQPVPVDCPMSTPPGLEAAGGSHWLAPGCWHSIRYPLRSGASQAVPLGSEPDAVLAPTAPIVAWLTLHRKATGFHSATAVVLPPIVGPPVAATPDRWHVQLNL